MDKSKIAIATMTWGRDEQEERLLREALEILANQGMPVFAADGGSQPELIALLDQLPNFHLTRAGSSGVFTQIRESLRRAANQTTADFILYTESDKKIFFDGQLADFISKAPSGENTGVVLAARSAGSFATFPEFQRYTETVINDLCREIVGVPGDYTYGPFLFNRKLIDCLDAADDEIGWGWRSFLFAVARRKGFEIVQIEGDYPCPAEQRGEDDRAARIYRIKQLSEHLNGLVASGNVPLEHC